MARHSPDRTAAYDHRNALTYAGLDRAANQVANAILAESGPGEEVIGLLVGVDLSALIAALGVLKAGKTYVALEASFPQKRSLFILGDAGVKLILSDSQHWSQALELEGSERKVLQIADLLKADPRPPGVPAPLDAPAMLNYTSGSTGQPKGVLQSHHSAVAQALRRFSYFRTSSADRVVVVGSLAWAASIWNLFGPLCLGACIGAFDIRRHTTTELIAWLEGTEPTIVTGRVLTRQLGQSNLQPRLLTVRVVTIGGDTLYREDAEAAFRLFPNTLVAVGLGLSETGRVTQLLLDSPQMLAWDVLPLGLPMPGMRVTLLDEDEQEVARGDVGEIAVTSPCLAAGYWQRPELTSARFRRIEALGTEPTFLSGDLGRQTPDGLLHHMGRKDHMVKIRGYQVFTNEVEAILRKVAGVEDACVAAHTPPEGNKQLVAYLVVDPEAFSGFPTLHARFEDLPRHMTPQSYVLLDALPKTAGGRKVDRSRLPVPKRSRLGVAADYVAPRDPVEDVLAELWGGVLNIGGLGIHDNFLELGGDSLDATRIISQVEAVLGLRLSLGEFLEIPTIAEMAARFSSTRQAAPHQSILRSPQ
jgi:amino acid adenylation domain-containing protein